MNISATFKTDSIPDRAINCSFPIMVIYIDYSGYSLIIGKYIVVYITTV